ncbi:leukocyte elastase inhibitor-like isoform X1 [Micropterus dolomieu]|uniref:leukocyte elastase inhibitor-like isoform X1 n=1 Tax=Micropterus dolomieu TaxID=147949 RepID=UPI001E8E81EE|nr:leukocyte elastase inhibitor-like isoform X1 [Micropterus dolomieu]XP_045905560.1 leukocyte elastase inhibitor-like isoform X1 [Micropterus dolomieu]
MSCAGGPLDLPTNSAAGRCGFSYLGGFFRTAACLYVLLSFVRTSSVSEQDALHSFREEDQENRTSSVMAAISKSNTCFALELFRTLSQENPTGNIFVSPLSISSALAMVYLGAKGNTAAQMAQVLSFNPGEDVHADFQTLNADINSPSASYILKLANRLYGEKTENFLPLFLEATEKYYQADLKAVNFTGAPEACRAEINSWVQQQTENKIKDLLKPGTVSSMTRLALVNAIYFKGNWMSRFKKGNTKKMPFKVNKNESKPVRMMYQKKKLPYNYVPELRLQILELPYVKEELSMFILLPEESADGSDPLLTLENELTLDRLDNWTNRDNMDVHSEVLVHLPKFKLEEDYELNEPLAKLGMTDVFCGPMADLSGMNGERGLFLSTVAHKAFVEVNEEGTEAAAATAGMVANCMLREEHFTADHPFLFFIRHNKTKSILFLGRFSSPQ